MIATLAAELRLGRFRHLGPVPINLHHHARLAENLTKDDRYSGIETAVLKIESCLVKSHAKAAGSKDA